LFNRRKKRDVRVYGNDKTIHRTGEVNVELDEKGNVVSVWYRCQPLPFTQRVVDDNRASSMTRMYEAQPAPFIEAIELKDEN